MNRWMDRRTDGRMDGWNDRKMGERKEKREMHNDIEKTWSLASTWCVLLLLLCRELSSGDIEKDIKKEKNNPREPRGKSHLLAHRLSSFAHRLSSFSPPLLFTIISIRNHSPKPAWDCTDRSGAAWIQCWDRVGKTWMALSLATVCTGMGIGSRTLLKGKKSHTQLSGQSYIQWSPVQPIPQMTEGYDLPDQPTIWAQWGQLLSHGTGHPRSSWIQCFWTHLAENIRPWNQLWVKTYSSMKDRTFTLKT